MSLGHHKPEQFNTRGKMMLYKEELFPVGKWCVIFKLLIPGAKYLKPNVNL